MGHRLFADSAKASGVRWLLVSLVLAVTGDLALDVPYYFGTNIPGFGALSGAASYRPYVSIISVVLPTVVGAIGFVGILRIERGRGWTFAWRGERARPALFVAAAAAAFLFASGLALALARGPVDVRWNSIRMTARFVVVLAGGVYLLDTAARIDPESRIGIAKMAFVVGTFAAAVRMLIAVYNGFVASNGPADFVTSQVVPLLAPAAFLLAVLSLFGWVAVYDGIRGRLTRKGAGGSPQAPLPLSSGSQGPLVGSEPSFETATSRPPAPRSHPGSTPAVANRDRRGEPSPPPGTPGSKDQGRSP
jgi:hypothetical protein